MIKQVLLASVCLLTANVFAQNTIFTEGFDTEENIAQWTNTDRDGDGEKWEFYNAEEEEMPAFSGNFATSWSWFFEAFTPDNTLTSPVISLPDTENSIMLNFQVGAFDEELFQEHYAVYVIPANTEFTGNEEPVFEETLDAGYTQEAKSVSILITEYKGQDVQLVFRHYDCTDIAFIGLDNISVEMTPGLATSELNKANVKIYPNPTNDRIKIEGVKTVEKIRIFDLSGRKVYESKGSEANIRELSAGTYIVNIYSGNQVVSRKIIKK